MGTLETYSRVLHRELHRTLQNPQMRITISYGPGLTVEGIVLSLDGSAMRVAVQGANDVREFRYSQGQWFSEYGEAVRVECLLANPLISCVFNVPETVN